MPNKKTRGGNLSGSSVKSARLNVPPVNLFSDHNEPWRKWNVKPTLEDRLADPPEAGIGVRIKYCRGQLDSLGVEALARYTKNFDAKGEGISRQSLIRYESGRTEPGARELRILCNALWVPANWLLLGTVSENPDSRLHAEFLSRLFAVIDSRSKSMPDREIVDAEIKTRQLKDAEIEQRRRWIHAARQPQSRRA